MPIEPPDAILSDLQHVVFTAKDATGTLIDATWSITPTLGTIDAGTYTAPPNITEPQDVSVTATPVAGGLAMKAVVTLSPVVTVIPANVTLRANERQRFVATVRNDPNNAVKWVVVPDILISGDAGVYTAPNPITDDQTITITAISDTNPTKAASATVHLLATPLKWPLTALLGLYLVMVFTLVLFLVGLWPPPAADKTSFETARAALVAAEKNLLTKATEARRAAEEVLKAKELEYTKAAEQATKSSALAERVDADQAAKDQAQKDKAAADQARSQREQAAKDLLSKGEAEKTQAHKLANAPEDYVLTGLGPLRRDVDLLLIVLIAGALGTFVHIARSFVDFVGNRTLRSSWGVMYLLYPFIGAALALIFYVAIRGGFLTAGTDVNPYGIVALAGLVGMFTKQATDKLSEVFTTLFRTNKEPELKDKLNPN